LKTVSHGGSWAGYRADLLRFPEQKLSVICLCNVANANPSRLARQVAEVYLGAQMKAAPASTPQTAAAPETVTLSEAEARAKAGLYHNAARGNLLRITLRDRKLWLSGPGDSSEELQALSPTRFRLANWPPSLEMRFEPAASGPHASLQMVRENAKPDVYERVEAFEPAADQLKEFAGAYYSEELDVTYDINIRDGKLIAAVKNQSFPLLAAYRGAFQAPRGVLLEFTRDAQGRVTGATVQAGRVRNIRFVRQ
jgi:YD repeat-containing protein